MIYYLYIIECQNNAYYTGYTTDIKRRYREHCNGSSKCKYTRSFPPKKLSAYWSMQLSLAEVLKLERAVKQLSKVQNLSRLFSSSRSSSIIVGKFSSS